MGRQIWMVFFGEPRHEAAAHAEESPKVMTVPLMVLAALSVLGGALNLPYLHTLTNWLEHTVKLVEHEGHVAAWLEVSWGGLNPIVALISTVAALLAIYISWLLYGRNPLKAGQIDPLKKPLGLFFTGAENKWFIDEAYQFAIIQPYYALAGFLAQTVDWDFWHEWFHDSVIAKGFVGLTRFLADPVDLGFIDRVSYVISDWVKDSSESLRKLQNGFVRSYALSVLVGVVAILGYLLLK
jgi:NADH-quinone oxidoreductase subunit L